MILLLNGASDVRPGAETSSGRTLMSIKALKDECMLCVQEIERELDRYASGALN